MHLKRWITAVVALPFLIAFLLKGGRLPFALFICFVSTIGLWEYFEIVFKKEKDDGQNLIIILGYISGPAIIFSAFINSLEYVFYLFAFNLILSGSISLTKFKTNPSFHEAISKQIQGLVYVPTLLSFLVLIRNGADGVTWIFMILCIIFAGDTGAYYAGTYLGRHKLCPAVSPGKTVEGSIGGLISNVIIGSLFKYSFLVALPWSTFLLFCLLIGITGQMGDLFESVLKRFSGVKDSGYILPGHGGVLDRIDALLFAAPIACFFKYFIFNG